jgi:hypothetical protein
LNSRTWNSEGVLSLAVCDYKFNNSDLTNIASKNILCLIFYRFLGVGFTSWFLSISLETQHYFCEIINFFIPRYDFLLCEYFLYDNNPIKVFYRFEYDFGFRYEEPHTIKTSNTNNNNNNDINNNNNNNNNNSNRFEFPGIGDSLRPFFSDIGQKISGFLRSYIKSDENNSNSALYKALYFHPGVHLLFDFSFYKYEKIKPFVRILPIGYNLILFTKTTMFRFLPEIIKVLIGYGSFSQQIITLHKISFVGFELGVILAKTVELCFLIKPFWRKDITNIEKPKSNPIGISCVVELKFIST